MKIVDVETGTREMPLGEAGELCICGPQVMKGYWNRPEESASGAAPRRRRPHLVPHRRHRDDGRGWLHVHRPAQEGHDHRGRLQRVSVGSRGRALHARGRAHGGGHRHARRLSRRSRQGLRRAARCVVSPSTSCARTASRTSPPTRCRSRSSCASRCRRARSARSCTACCATKRQRSSTKRTKAIGPPPCSSFANSILAIASRCDFVGAVGEAERARVRPGFAPAGSRRRRRRRRAPGSRDRGRAAPCAARPP